jgi:hypothetical protein
MVRSEMAKRLLTDAELPRDNADSWLPDRLRSPVKLPGSNFQFGIWLPFH